MKAVNWKIKIKKSHHARHNFWPDSKGSMYFSQRRKSHNALLQGQQKKINKKSIQDGKEKIVYFNWKMDYFKVKYYWGVSLATC